MERKKPKTERNNVKGQEKARAGQVRLHPAPETSQWRILIVIEY